MSKVNITKVSNRTNQHCAPPDIIHNITYVFLQENLYLESNHEETQKNSNWGTWSNFPGGSVVKNPPGMWETRVWFLGWKDPLEKGMATHSSTPAWNIPWTEAPDGLQSTGSKELDTTERLTLTDYKISSLFLSTKSMLWKTRNDWGTVHIKGETKQPNATKNWGFSFAVTHYWYNWWNLNKVCR